MCDGGCGNICLYAQTFLKHILLFKMFSITCHESLTQYTKMGGGLHKMFNWSVALRLSKVLSINRGNFLLELCRKSNVWYTENKMPFNGDQEHFNLIQSNHLSSCKELKSMTIHPIAVETLHIKTKMSVSCWR